MLKNIRLHLESDEQKQDNLEAEFVLQANNRLAKNKDAFLRNIPAILPYFGNISNKNISVFCNRSGQANIVNFNNGRTFYGFDPEAEIARQVKNFSAHAPCILLSENKLTPASGNQTSSDFRQRQMSWPAAPSEIDCLVVFGIGLGLHLETLISRYQIDHLVIYEPDIQYFQCSTRTCNWFEIFRVAKQKNTSIYLQLEKDGRQVIHDIQELSEVASLNKVYLYRHYNHVVFNRALNQLTSLSWRDLKNVGFSFDLNETLYDYSPLWTTPCASDLWSDVKPDAARYRDNMNAFKSLFPDIHAQMQDYKPRKWLPVQNKSGQINLLNRDTGTYWYGDDPVDESELHYQSFCDFPNKDGLVLGYDGEKLAHYIHYQFIAKTEALLKTTTDHVGALPEDVPSIIMFGLAAGYQLETMFFDRKIENLFVCEPNLDFFHASLFAIDWKSIFKRVAEQELRIYINLGESSGTLIKDLMGQFYSIGPYLLNNTYFYQSYYNTALNSSVSQLREQLQIVIAMGEYFDHAYYGIAHTKASMQNQRRFLTNNPADKLNFYQKEVPIFIVGNGPSLDDSIATIKEFKDQAIIISCGTALQALFKHNITPDFQAEIEQNRTTYDWASLINADHYLKGISLIACNGIHPDTMALYKDVYITFKEGESSTVSVTKVFGEDKFEILKFAFPTVANFITNLITRLGFHNVYFLGVDLGFVDVKRHHSRLSAYYKEDGTQVFDYEKKNNTNLIVPGNFRARVNTKHEFYIARQMLEQSIASKIKEVNFYNCSDGAAIAGATALRTEQILLATDMASKKETLDCIKNRLFQASFNDAALQDFDNHYSIKLLREDFTLLQSAAEQPLTTFEDGEKLTRLQRKLLFDSYKDGKSLFFYYLYGTVNYANAVIAKLIYASSDAQILQQSLTEFRLHWLDYLSEIAALLFSDNLIYDTSKYRAASRALLRNKQRAEDLSIGVFTDSQAFVKATQITTDMFIKDFSWHISGEIVSKDKTSTVKHDLVIYFIEFLNAQEQLKTIDSGLQLGNESTIFVVAAKFAHLVINKLRSKHPKVNVMVIINEDFDSPRPGWLSSHLFIVQRAIELGLQGYHGVTLLPKYLVKERNNDSEFLKRCQPVLAKTGNIVDFSDHIAIFELNEKQVDLLPNGDRALQRLMRTLEPRDLILSRIKDDELQKIVDNTLTMCPQIISDKYLLNTVIKF